MKNSSLLVAVFLLLQTAVLSQSGWQWQNPMPQGNNLYDICDDPPHPGRLFAVGDQGTILKKDNLSDWQIVEQGNFENLYSAYFKGIYGWAVGYNGTILQNIDGLGNTWYPLNSGTTKQLLSVFFFDQLNGWVVGQDQTILHTSDGGTRWDSQSYTGSEHYFSVYFTSLLNGWIAGAAGSNGVIKKTTNSGMNWVNSLIPTNRMNSIKFIDENIGCVVGDAGKIFTTTNAGTDWNLAVSNTTSDLRDFYMNTSGEGWAVGYDGTMIHTTNYGSLWNVETSPTNQIIYGIENDYAVGWAGIILHRGTNWVLESTGYTNHLSGIDFSADAVQGFAVGEEGLVLTTTDAGTTWVQDNSGTNNDFYAIDVTNYPDGLPLAIIVGDNGKVLTGIKGDWYDRSIATTDRLYAAFRFVGGKAWVAGEFGRIWKTTNSGQSWVLQHENMAYHLHTIQFISKNYGWAAGMSGSILKTTNGGDDWIDVSPDNLEFFRSIYFLDYDNGWVVGNGGAIYSTTDGGDSWIELLPKVTYETLNKISFVNANIGWIVGATGSIFLTTNGGANWQQQNSPSNSFMTSASFPETGVGWICGRDGAILHTTDGGGTISYEIYERNYLNLSIPDPGETNDLIEVQIVPKTQNGFSLSGVAVLIDSVIHPDVSDLAFVLSHDGVTDTLIAQSEIAGSNIFYCSLTDAASNPLEEGESPYGGGYKPHSSLSVFSGMNPNGEWALTVIDLVSGNSGTLQAWGLKLFFDVATGVEPDYSNLPNDFKVYQNYPNPFNPSTTINWQMPQDGLVTLKIYDVLGREIITLVNEELNAGKHEAMFDASRFSSGIYFYQLKAEDYINTKKMILIK
jgi:photosystem II stability/assembly factor-like uncharacterized protein